MNVAGEIEIECLHRHNLRKTAARCATLDAKGRPLRRLAKTDDGTFTDVLHCLAEADQCRRFSLAERRRGYRRDVDIFCVRPIFGAFEHVETKFSDVWAAVNI